MGRTKPRKFIRHFFSIPLSKNAPEGYVSNRNMIFYSIAAHFAELHGCDALIGGHTAEDEEAFPDAGAFFFERLTGLMNEALLLEKIRIELPLIRLTKLEVLQKAMEWKVPLQYTWSCYWDRSTPCGECISCKERADAFEKLGVRDPLLNLL
jgi:7-cyano-7-deazaguanine synthase